MEKPICGSRFNFNPILVYSEISNLLVRFSQMLSVPSPLGPDKEKELFTRESVNVIYTIYNACERTRTTVPKET